MSLQFVLSNAICFACSQLIFTRCLFFSFLLLVDRVAGQCPLLLKKKVNEEAQMGMSKTGQCFVRNPCLVYMIFKTPVS